MSETKFTPGDVLAQMRSRDRVAGNRPLLCEQARIMGDTLHWSTTHSWPTVCDEMVSLGLVRIVARPGYPITEITDLGREVRAALAKARGETSPNQQHPSPSASAGAPAEGASS